MWFSKINALEDFRIHMRKSRTSLFAALAMFMALFGLPSTAQITLSYGTLDPELDDETLQDTSVDWAREYLALAYAIPVTSNLSLSPSLSLVGEQSDSLTTVLTDPDGVSLGLWGRYDLLSYGAGSTYADGRLTYLDYDLEDQSTPAIGNEFQFSLGVGADMALTDRVSAFTNLSYTYVDGSQDGEAYEGSGAGLEIGIELSF